MELRCNQYVGSLNRGQIHAMSGDASMLVMMTVFIPKKTNRNEKHEAEGKLMIHRSMKEAA